MNKFIVTFLFIELFFSSKVFGMAFEFKIKPHLPLKQQLIKSIFKSRKDFNLSGLPKELESEILGYVPDSGKCVLNSNNGRVCFAQFIGNEKIIILSNNMPVSIWDLKTGDCTDISIPLKGYVYGLCFNECNKFAFTISMSRMFLSSNRFGEICIYDLSAKSTRTLTTDGYCTAVVNSMELSKGGKLLLIGRGDGAIHLIDLSKELENTRILNESCNVSSAQFSNNENYIISITTDNTIKIWDKFSFEKPVHILKGHSNSISSACFSHDDKYVISASSDNTIRIWDLTKKSDYCVRVLQGHNACVNYAEFNSDLNLVVSASADKTLKLWDLSAKVGEECIYSYNHANNVSLACFSNNSRCVFSVSNDTTITVLDLWNLPR